MIIQDMSELPPAGQLAMMDPVANYKLNVQTSFARNVAEANILFDGTAIIPATWSGLPWNMKGFPQVKEIIT